MRQDDGDDAQLVPDLWGGTSPQPDVPSVGVLVAKTDPEADSFAVAQARGDARRAQARARQRARTARGNPLVALVGPDPDGRHCWTCVFFMTISYHDSSYFKCAMRGQPTHGNATDHRKSWPACARYRAAPNGFKGEITDQSDIDYLLALAQGKTDEAPEVAFARLRAAREARLEAMYAQWREERDKHA